MKGLAVVTAVACLGGCSLAVDVGDYAFYSDAPPPPCAPVSAARCSESGRTLAFVVSVVDVGREEPTGVAPGFDLDGLDGRLCRQRDFVSPDGEHGIDNQFAPFVDIFEAGIGGMSLADIARAQILMGNDLRIIELRGVDDLANDDCVTMNSRPARLLDGMTLDDLDRVAPSGEIDPGLTLEADPPRLFDTRACIRGGRVFASFDEAVTSFGAEDPIEILTRRNLISARIVDEGGGSFALKDGLQGGSVDAAEIDAAFAGVLGAGTLTGLVKSDLEPDEEGRCTAISFAFTFEAVAASF